MTVPVLVLYPHSGRYYPQHEVYARLDGYECTLVAPDSAFARASQVTMGFLESPTRHFFGLHPVGVGELEHLTFPKVSEVIDRISPDVIITFEAFSASSYQVSRIRRRRRFYHVVLCDSTSPPSRSLWRYSPTTALFCAEVLRSADLFISHTERSSEALRQLGVPDELVCLVPAGIRPPFEVTRIPSKLPGFRVLYLGALRRNKGIRTLLRAFREVRRQCPDAELWMGGNGPLAGEIASTVLRSPGLRYLGWVQDRDKPQIYSEVHLFALPSEDQFFLGLIRWQEQTAVSAIEAMLAGLPAIGSDSGALPETLGFADALFPQGSSRDLARLIKRARSEPSWLAELQRRQQDRSRRLFDIDASRRSLEKAFHSLRAMGRSNQ